MTDQNAKKKKMQIVSMT